MVTGVFRVIRVIRATEFIRVMRATGVIRVMRDISATGFFGLLIFGLLLGIKLGSSRSEGFKLGLFAVRGDRADAYCGHLTTVITETEALIG
jgi:hypothetical protein